MNDLAEIAAADVYNDDNDSGDISDGEDILADIIATPSESLDSSRSPDAPPEDPHGEEDGTIDPIPDMPEPRPAPPPPQTSPRDESSQEESPPQQTGPFVSEKPEAPITTTTSQSLRPRRLEQPHLDEKPDSPSAAEATGSSTHALFGDRNNSGTRSTVATTEAILDLQREQQDALSGSILKLASDLKASSQAFSASLDEDKATLSRAGEGINKTGSSMDAVTRRMGTLQRMTEGEGWWGRMRLYAMIYGLMVVLVLVVFVFPKLRF